MRFKTKKHNRQMFNKTKKIYGGDIYSENNILRNILSIGYELETQNLSKFTLTTNSDGEENVLLNTNAVAKDYEKLKANEEDTEELFEIDCYTTSSLNKYAMSKSKKKPKLSVNKNTVFLVANDMASSPFSKYLNSYCNLNTKTTTPDDDSDDSEDELIDKDELYTFETVEGDTYYLNFDINPKQDCGLFADVEWIMTYYEPKRSKNIIIDTFVNVIKNLLYHLNSLEKTSGKLIMHFDENDTEIMERPEFRTLYHLPDTNLYYMETILSNEKLDLDDICLVPQMTFSCKIKDVVDIFKELIKDDIKLIKNYAIISEARLKLVGHLETCINKLFAQYNKSVKSYKIVESKNKPLVKEMKGCLFLILFKLNRYYNAFLTDEKVKKKLKTSKYLKDTLFFNSRHTNYDLYKELKTLINAYFSNALSNEEVVTIIQHLVIQQEILNDYLLEDKKNVRVNAFSIKNKLEIGNKSYGNPHYSLVSYFDFFENPIKETERRNDKDELFHDWLQYEGIDIYSSTTDLKNKIVLTEIRTFPRLLGSYMYSIADETLKNNMTNGICNRLRKYYQPDLGAFSILALKQFVELYEKK
jgi:hypothetical protein